MRKKIILTILGMSVITGTVFAVESDESGTQQIQSLNTINTQVRKVQQNVKVEREKITEFKKETVGQIQEFRKEVQEEKAEYIEKIKNTENTEEREALKTEMKEEMKDRLQEIKKNYLKKKLELVEKRLDAYISKFEQISERIEGRLVILESEGYDISIVRELQEKIQEYLNAAIQDLEDFKVLVQEASTVETTEELKEILKKSREELKTAKDNIKNSYRVIKEIIKEMKEMVRSNEDKEGDKEQ